MYITIIFKKKLLRETGIQSLQIHFFSNVIEYWIGVKERENIRKKLFVPSKDLKNIKRFYIELNCMYLLYKKTLLFYRNWLSNKNLEFELTNVDLSNLPKATRPSMSFYLIYP